MTIIEVSCLVASAAGLAVFLAGFRMLDEKRIVLESRVLDLELREDRRLRKDLDAVQAEVRLARMDSCMDEQERKDRKKTEDARHEALCERIDALAGRVDRLELPSRADAEREAMRRQAR